MNTPQPAAQPSTLGSFIQVDPVDRWSIYHRLKELSIPCHCQGGQLLQVQANTATNMLIAWSVIRQITSSRQDKVSWLHQCWQSTTLEN
jgi:hypothetical protein